ncbi:MAG: DUF134 domain-containing protein [Candidatus Berkelbacteria bacterium]|nr:DUF134 domain-containing protein [Candidatus Berkelbacteria bacterium]
MSRTKKCRCVEFKPSCLCFKPQGKRSKCGCEVSLFEDELESIKLIDFDGLDQLGAARKMKVSRVTVQRIYKSAREKIANALILGKEIAFRRGGD